MSGFLNLGNDPARYHYGRGSNYFKVWCMANREMPRKGQRMAPADFIGKFFRVRVDYAKKNGHGKDLSPAEQYSKIVEFLEGIGP